MLVVLALSLGMASSSNAVELLRWQRLPLAVPLIVGQERVVFIDRNVRIGIPPGVGDRLRVQSAGGAIYLRASDVLPPTRLQLQDVETGALILLDIAADEAWEGQTPLEPVRIVEDETLFSSYGRTGVSANEEENSRHRPSEAVPWRETPVPVRLTRYAAQSLYAPLRAVEPVAGIGRVGLNRELVLDTLLPTLPIRARALAAWRLQDHYVTAVRLTNRSGRWIDLDPRVLQGDFITAAFQHPNLGPVGESTDTTVVYLVTRGHGLAESLLPALSPIDAAVNLPSGTAAGEADSERKHFPRAAIDGETFSESSGETSVPMDSLFNSESLPTP